MSRDSWNDNEWDDQLDDPEGPQACDLPGDGEEDDDYKVLACPHCGLEISELTERCPHCGDWIVAGGGGGSTRKPLTLIIAILLILALLLWIF